MLSPIYTPILYCDLCLTTQKSQFAKHKFGEREREREMKRRSMFTVGKNKGVALSVHRKPLQHMVQRRLRELKKIVPDAHEDNVDVLLRQTAEYICILELKVAVLRKLAAIYGA